MENNKFVMIDENGQEREYDVLFTFESEKEWKVIETILETLQEEVKKKVEQQNNEQ